VLEGRGLGSVSINVRITAVRKLAVEAADNGLLAGVTGRFHDARHTLITELCEAGAGDQTFMEIAGHVSPQMLKRYSHIRMTAKRAALDSMPQKAKAVPPVETDQKEQSETIQ
jgi:integrase